MFAVLAQEFCKWRVLSACQAVAVMLHLITNYVKYNKRGKSLEMTSFSKLVHSGYRPIQTGRMTSQLLINFFDLTALGHLKILWVDFALAAQLLHVRHFSSKTFRQTDRPAKGTAFLNVLSREDRCICWTLPPVKDLWVQTDTMNFFPNVFIYQGFN